MKFRTDDNKVDLCGRWQFAYGEAPAGEFRSAEQVRAAMGEVHDCTVPGNFELDLQENGIIGDPFFGMNMAATRQFEGSHKWYFTRFSATSKDGYDAHLVLEGVDCIADVFINGQLVCSVDNMLVEHELNIDDFLAEDGENEILVHIKPVAEAARTYPYASNLQSQASNFESLYIRKAPHMFGWDIMPKAVSAGIWRPIFVQYKPKVRIENVYLETCNISSDRKGAWLAFKYELKLGGADYDNYRIILDAKCGDTGFRREFTPLFEWGNHTFGIENPVIWWPKGRGEPKLYDVHVSLLYKGSQADHVTFRHGIRTVKLERTSVTDDRGSGEFVFWVNGEKVFMKGSNWVPLDAYHSRDVERLPKALEMAVDLNCNMLRCWGGNVYENDLFFDICDEQGIMVWQDFAMACAIYPQDDVFCEKLRQEARKVVRRLRQHPSLALWCGDNECDAFYLLAAGRPLNPNVNKLTREVLPRVLQDEDNTRPYLPSSPYIDETAFPMPSEYLSETHAWGSRCYFKSTEYLRVLAHFVSEFGYHGCPAPESVREFISPGKQFPYENDEWLLHCTSPIPGANLNDYRVQLMVDQVMEMFGHVPDTLEEFSFASQVVQAEAKKFFIEMMRYTKWRHTGILWWNLLDGWPQFSDAIVDYYFRKKLAYDFIKRSQQQVCVTVKEPLHWNQAVVVCNDDREDVDITYRVWDIDTDGTLLEGSITAKADAVTPIGSIRFFHSAKRFYVMEWHSRSGRQKNHYLAGFPPFDVAKYREWLGKFASI